MTGTERPLRADARRNREKIMASAAELFARLGTEAQMDQIAEHSGLGLGTLYRHFPTKDALLAAIVGKRFEDLAGLALEAERIADPGEAFETLLRRYLESAEGDAAFQLAVLDSGRGGLQKAPVAHKGEFRAILGRIIERAIAAGAVRADLTVADFPVIAGGVMATMYYQPGDWRRHLDLVLDGIRVT
ncbi:TetR/AcrR family transcriptional regulator [Dactylosporangium sp. CS-033363]|uniref:TetR/AcrR family transcriptional regulator n=1 Tax=Dactylosporangium sp. CS-033363 TaxID=3239935 RepID=UPI003D8FAC3A